MSEISKKRITEYIRARYAVLVIESFEEERVLAELQSVATDIHHEIYIWNSTEGVRFNGKLADAKTADLRAAIDFCESKA